MTTHESQEAAPRSVSHRLVSLAGGIVAGVAILAHVAGGAALMHLGLGGILSGLGADVADLGAGALAIAAAALIAIKLLVVFAARRRWLRR